MMKFSILFGSILTIVFAQKSLQNPFHQKHEIADDNDINVISSNKNDRNIAIEGLQNVQNKNALFEPGYYHINIVDNVVETENSDLDNPHNRSRREIKKFFNKLIKSAEKRFKEAWPIIVTSAVQG